MLLIAELMAISFPRVQCQGAWDGVNTDSRGRPTFDFTDASYGGGSPDHLAYFIDVSETALAPLKKYVKDVTTNANPPNLYTNYYCRDLFRAGPYRVGKTGLSLEMRPGEASLVPWYHMQNRECCWKASEPCRGCYLLTERRATWASRVQMSVYTMKGTTKLQLVEYLWCIYCPQLQCGVVTCTNGQYAGRFADIDPVTNLGMVNPECYDCAPGTWNTCRNDASCQW